MGAGPLGRISVSRIKGILDRSEQARVLVVGDLMLDRYVSGSVTRISPESPVPVVQVEKEWASVGGAANVAAKLVALGAQCDVVGCVGSDDAGHELRERLELRCRIPDLRRRGQTFRDTRRNPKQRGERRT